MEDYSAEILKIILSGVRFDSCELNGQSHVPQLLELSDVVRRLNSFMRNETFRLESEIVALTEQLLESESLLIANREKPSYSASRSKPRIKKSKMMNLQ